MRAAAIALICLAVAGCSKSATADLRHDVKDTGQALKAAADNVKTDPDLRRAGDDIKHAGHDMGAALKSGAEDAKADADRAGDKAKKAADDVKHDVKDGNS